MITPDGWLDWSIRKPGPVGKYYDQTNSVDGYIPHSAVGSTLATIDIVMSSAKKSVAGVISYDGSVIQFYPITRSCWASGSQKANTHFVAFENEGGFLNNVSELLTPEQVEANIRIIKDIGAWKSINWRRPVNVADVEASLYEHNECTRFGSAPTACPSGRIPWDTILRQVNMKDGWLKEGNFWVLYNNNIPVRQIGSTDGQHQGREAWNFGGTLWWIRHFYDGSFQTIPRLSTEEGD